jgi:hypothetical protein
VTHPHDDHRLDARVAYAAPHLVELGSLRELTQGGLLGDLDGDGSGNTESDVLPL